jgi:hypothetical protein
MLTITSSIVHTLLHPKLIAPPKTSINIFGGKVWQPTLRNTILRFALTNTTKNTSNNMVFSLPKLMIQNHAWKFVLTCLDPQDNKKKKKLESKPLVDMQGLLVLVILDPDTNATKMTALLSKLSIVVARGLVQTWLCCYPHPL